jgi:hypothetical protein
MARRRKSLIPGLSWSWKRAIGLSGLKTKVSRKIGVPLTRGGLERKVGRAVLSRIGCLVPLAILSGVSFTGYWLIH